MEPVKKLGSVRDGPNVYEIEDRRGYLTCSLCHPKSAWPPLQPCTHVMDAMRIDLDAVSDEYLSGWVSVPIVGRPRPGRGFKEEASPFSVLAYVDPPEHGMAPFKVQIYQTESTYQEEVVGYLDQGEGRRPMRLVLLEWLRSKYYTVGPCPSNRHKRYEFSLEERRQKNLDSKQMEVLHDVASILSIGQCRRCAATVHESDLVPDL
jgi:hypothetical protein